MPDSTETALAAPKAGYQTSEFMLTSAGMFISALISLLSVFGVLNLSSEQTMKLYEFTAISWVVLPTVYGSIRAHTKGKSLTAIAVVEAAKVAPLAPAADVTTTTTTKAT